MENPQPVATSSSSRWSSDDSVTRTAASISTDRSTKTITPNGVSQSLGASAHLSDSRDSLNAPMGQATYPVQGTMSSYNKPLKTSPSTSSFSSITTLLPQALLTPPFPSFLGRGTSSNKLLVQKWRSDHFSCALSARIGVTYPSTPFISKQVALKSIHVLRCSASTSQMIATTRNHQSVASELMRTRVSIIQLGM
jgi:hypothetical protein